MRRLVFIVALFYVSVANAQLFPFGGGGSTFNPASPGNIGTTTPGTGSFTALGVNQAAPANGLAITSPASSNNSINITSNASNFSSQFTSTENGNSSVEFADGANSSLLLHSGTTVFRVNDTSDTHTDLTISSAGTVTTPGYFTSSTAAAISGGGALATGSNAFAGRITGLAATSNILTPGFTCVNAVTCTFQDDTTAGGVKVTAQGTATITFSATASDTADYHCGCR